MRHLLEGLKKRSTNWGLSASIILPFFISRPRRIKDKIPDDATAIGPAKSIPLIPPEEWEN